MDIVGGKVSITGTVRYERNGYTGGGGVDSGDVVWDPEGLVNPDRTILRAGRLEIVVGGLTGLPDLIASLVLEQPDGDESPKGFADRLKRRDDIAEAFYQAALRIKQAPRE